MIDFYFWTTPNGYKPLLFLEEAGLEYRIVPVNISKGEQFDPEFLAISPNNKIPAIVDHAPMGGHSPIALFESGAILLYLAEKADRFIPTTPLALAGLGENGGSACVRNVRDRWERWTWISWRDRRNRFHQAPLDEKHRRKISRWEETDPHSSTADRRRPLLAGRGLRGIPRGCRGSSHRDRAERACNAL